MNNTDSTPTAITTKVTGPHLTISLKLLNVSENQGALYNISVVASYLAGKYRKKALGELLVSIDRIHRNEFTIATSEGTASSKGATIAVKGWMNKDKTKEYQEWRVFSEPKQFMDRCKKSMEEILRDKGYDFTFENVSIPDNYPNFEYHKVYYSHITTPSSEPSDKTYQSSQAGDEQEDERVNAEFTEEQVEKEEDAGTV